MKLKYLLAGLWLATIGCVEIMAIDQISLSPTAVHTLADEHFIEVPTLEQKDTCIVVDDTTINLQYPLMEDMGTYTYYISLDDLSAIDGVEAVWLADFKSAVIKYDNSILEMSQNISKAIINSEVVPVSDTDKACLCKYNDIVYIPLRFALNILDCKVRYNKVLDKIEIEEIKKK